MEWGFGGFWEIFVRGELDASFDEVTEYPTLDYFWREKKKKRKWKGKGKRLRQRRWEDCYRVSADPMEVLIRTTLSNDSLRQTFGSLDSAGIYCQFPESSFYAPTEVAIEQL